SELAAVPKRLLQVVAENLLVLSSPLPEPGRIPFVELGAHLLGHGGVRRLPDQGMTEADALLVGEGRPMRTYEILAHEFEQARAHAVVLLLGGERLDSPAMEHVALDRRAFERPPLGLFELVEPGRQEDLNRRR